MFTFLSCSADTQTEIDRQVEELVQEQHEKRQLFCRRTTKSGINWRNSYDALLRQRDPLNQRSAEMQVL